MRKGFVVLLSMALLMLLAFDPVTHAANPAIAQTVGGNGLGVTTVVTSLGAVTSGDKIVVFEYFGTAFSPCSYIKTPTDSQSNNYQTFGCVSDSQYAAQQMFYATGRTGADTVTCNWQPNAGDVESCYVFDVTAPGQVSMPIAISNFGSGVGVSVPNVQANTLLLATVGMDGSCRTVGLYGVNSVTSSVAVYNPANECNAIDFGLSGASDTAVTSTTQQWIFTFPSQTSTLIVASIAPQTPAQTTTTAYTATVTGWLAPDAAHFSNSLLLMTLPLAGMVFGIMFAEVFQVKGDIGVYFALVGLTLGSLMADLPTAGTGGSVGIPFAYTVTSALLTFLYWYNS